ncbi:MAG: hypothetical protein H6817_07260 [Phycisphaerales bacterium]|nr:hypothetical protein [Phycisphaerales bacterium]
MLQTRTDVYALAAGPGPLSKPTDRPYWLMDARNARSGVSWQQLLAVALGRWHVEKWFERAKQETGFGAFEVRMYTSLIRHWLCARMAMYFRAAQTQRLRGEKPADHAGAGRGRREHAGIQDLEPLVACLG